MKLIVGLGNPGNEYKNTRHNAGFMVVDKIAGNKKWTLRKKFEAEICEIKPSGAVTAALLARPVTFMNESGRAVRKIVDFYKIKLKNLYLIHDDLDLRLGEYKLQMGKGPKAHNGVISVEKYLRGVDFWRLRVGVNARQSGLRFVSGDDYVLEAFSKTELKDLSKVVDEVVEAMAVVLE
jgi:PTH1 family peptidyl-tRNA hydrolase